VTFESLLQLAESRFIPRKLLEIWIPEAKFLTVAESEDSLSITRIDEPFFGFGFGPNPIIDNRWSRCAITRSTPDQVTSNLELVNQWDAFGIETRDFEINYELDTDFKKINNLIETHAPELSIRAEDDEVITWVQVDNCAFGAICKWESGGHVLSAIFVKKEMRGKGLGKLITKALVTEACRREIDYVALGVMAENKLAIETYKSVGFEELGKFNTFKSDSI